MAPYASRWKVSVPTRIRVACQAPTNKKSSYDDHCITFIASKCDDISCSEVIHALRLYDDPDLLEIEEKIGELTEQLKEHKQRKNAAEKIAKGGRFP